MQTLDAYEYRLQGRRPTTYATLGLGMGLTYVNAALDAPALAWTIASLVLTLALYRLALNRAAGIRLGRGRLEVYAGTSRRIVALARIAGAEMGRKSCLLHLSDGSRLALPRAALPPARRLAEELRACGVPVNFGDRRTTPPHPAWR